MKSRSSITTEEALAPVRLEALATTLFRHPDWNVYMSYSDSGLSLAADFNYGKVYDALKEQLGCQYCAKCQKWYSGKGACTRCHTSLIRKRKSVSEIMGLCSA